MEWTILDGFPGANPVGEQISTALRGQLEEQGKRYAYFRLNDMQISACRSCGGCAYKSPGRCVLKDDLHTVLSAAASSVVIAILTPIRFGGYPSQLKKAVERFMVLGSPYYTIWRGRLMHANRYGDRSLLTIGVNEASISGQAEAFHRLAKRNANNLLCRQHRSAVLTPTETEAERTLVLDQLMGEALQW